MTCGLDTPVRVSRLLSEALRWNAESRRLTASVLLHVGSHWWSGATWQKLITVYRMGFSQKHQAGMLFV